MGTFGAVSISSARPRRFTFIGGMFFVFLRRRRKCVFEMKPRSGNLTAEA